MVAKPTFFLSNVQQTLDFYIDSIGQDNTINERVIEVGRELNFFCKNCTSTKEQNMSFKMVKYHPQIVQLLDFPDNLARVGEPVEMSVDVQSWTVPELPDNTRLRMLYESTVSFGVNRTITQGSFIGPVFRISSNCPCVSRYPGFLKRKLKPNVTIDFEVINAQEKRASRYGVRFISDLMEQFLLQVVDKDNKAIGRFDEKASDSDHINIITCADGENNTAIHDDVWSSDNKQHLFWIPPSNFDQGQVNFTLSYTKKGGC